ncbi:hypothetical protein XELAEV_18029160mg [Xenopus laevis]|uniref:Uncharacterized protein n=1 Tax=Xenopus laevis TaxID=8355 RepID=A0A974HHB0_XENLA|nr:hypothetical protein XELAEV_18029160mg [Xenopus laevis]
MKANECGRANQYNTMPREYVHKQNSLRRKGWPPEQSPDGHPMVRRRDYGDKGKVYRVLSHRSLQGGGRDPPTASFAGYHDNSRRVLLRY